MKKILILLAGLAMALAACTKKEMKDDSAQTERVSWPSVITVATEPVVDAETKSVIADNGAFSWFAGTGETAEKLGIYTNAGFKVYTCTDAATGTFGGDLGGATPSTVAVYPAGQYDLSTKTLTVKMPASYEYVPTLAKTPMIAQISGSIDNLTFKHIAALLKVSVKNVPPTATQLVLETDENIAGDFVISDCTVADAVITNDGGSAKSVSVNFPAAGDFTDKNFFIPIPVGTYAHFNLFLKDENGNKLAGRQFAGTGTTIARKELASGSAIELPRLELSDAIVLNDTQIGLRWSENAFATTSAAITADKDPAYTFGIYSDAACTSKLWDWETAANAAVFTSTPGHVFSGLAPETTYYIKVKDATNGIAAVKAFTTTAAETNFVKTDVASAEDVILYENFDDIIYGTDHVQRLSGVDLKDDDWATPIGRPDATTNAELAKAGAGERNMITNAHQSTTSIGYNYFNSKPLYNWSSYYGASGTAENQYPTIVVGGLRFGGSSRTGYIVSPALESLTANAIVTVKVTAGAQSAGRKLYVAVFPACDVTGTYKVIKSAPINEYEVAEVSVREYTEYCIDVPVPAGGRIGVGTKFGGDVTELYVDKVEAKYKEVGPSIMQQAVYVNNSQIAVRWSTTGFKTIATDLATAYTFGVYTDAACTSPVYPAYSTTADNKDASYTSSQAFATGYFPGFVFSYLKPGTDYYVKITSGSDESVVKYTTTNLYSNGVKSETAAPGDVILFQDFNEFSIETDFVNKISGLWIKGDGYGTGNFGMPSAANNVKAASDSHAFGGYNNILNSSSGTGFTWYKNSTIGQWAALRNHTSTIYWCLGALWLGADARLISPQINCLSGNATLKVTLKVCGNAGRQAGVYIYDNFALSGNKLQTSTEVAAVSSELKPVSAYSGGYKEVEFTVSGFVPGQRIGLGADAASIFIDEVKVELVSYDD